MITNIYEDILYYILQYYVRHPVLLVTQSMIAEKSLFADDFSRSFVLIYRDKNRLAFLFYQQIVPRPVQPRSAQVVDV